MGVLVETSKGFVDREHLVVKDEVSETEDARTIQTVWLDKNTGDEVRRDVTVSILRGISVVKRQGV